MGKIIAIALNTYRESVRDKIFYSLLAFAILLICFSLILGKLSIAETYKIIQDFGLMSISLFGTLTAIFVGIGMLYKEIEKRTVYIVLAKPIARWQFIIGKYCGLSLTLLVMVVAMSASLFLICYLWVGKIPFGILYAIVAICFELELILAFALFFSSFSTPFLSGLFTFSVFVIGHLTVDLKVMSGQLDDIFLSKLIDFFYYTFPNFERLNFKSSAVHNLGISFSEISTALLYSAIYTVVVLLGTIIVFNRVDLK